MKQREVLHIDFPVKEKLVQKLKAQGEVLSFQDDEGLASLCTSLGLQFELGNPKYDRLSPFFGVDLTQEEINPWESEIFILSDKIGIVFRRKDGKPLQLRHEDFLQIIDPRSFDENGELSQIVIFPSDVAKNYKILGLNLVIVCDWILTSALSFSPETEVPYLSANTWEIEHNIARLQAQTLVHQSLAFSGTHDIADHLLGGNGEGLKKRSVLFKQAATLLERIEKQRNTLGLTELILSYLAGIVLDDMAQPRWYVSQNHDLLLATVLHSLDSIKSIRRNDTPLSLPESFHALTSLLRDRSVTPEGLNSAYLKLLASLE